MASKLMVWMTAKKWTILLTILLAAGIWWVLNSILGGEAAP